MTALNCIRELKALGVDVYFEKENIHTMKNEGELLQTLISATAQQESQAQSDNVKWGIRWKYERGHMKSIPSGKFLEYDKDEYGNLIINKAQAEIVVEYTVTSSVSCQVKCNGKTEIAHFQPRTFLGRKLINSWARFTDSGVGMIASRHFGKNCLTKPLVFSLVAR